MTSQEKPAAQSDNLPTPSEQDGLVTACHCGRVQVKMPSKPLKLNECHCTVCYKYGALWGYFGRSEVTVTTSDGATLAKYIRADNGDGDLSFNRCSHCGCMTHWWGEGDYAGLDHKMGINCRMLPLEAIEGIPRKISYC